MLTFSHFLYIMRAAKGLNTLGQDTVLKKMEVMALRAANHMSICCSKTKIIVESFTKCGEMV